MGEEIGAEKLAGLLEPLKKVVNAAMVRLEEGELNPLGKEGKLKREVALESEDIIYQIIDSDPELSGQVSPIEGSRSALFILRIRQGKHGIDEKLDGLTLPKNPGPTSFNSLDLSVPREILSSAELEKLAEAIASGEKIPLEKFEQAQKKIDSRRL